MHSNSENPDRSIGLEVPHAKAMVAIHTIAIDSQQGYDGTVRFLADYMKSEEIAKTANI